MTTKSIHIRIDAGIKDKAEGLFSNLGLGLSDASNIFFCASLNDNGFPFLANDRNDEAMDERRRRKFCEVFGNRTLSICLLSDV